MRHECKITVLETKVFPELQEKYLADPKSGPCPCFKAGDTFLLKRTPERDDFYHLITCCNDGTRPVIFKIERIDIPENEEEEQWLAKQNFKNTAEDAYTG